MNLPQHVAPPTALPPPWRQRAARARSTDARCHHAADAARICSFRTDRRRSAGDNDAAPAAVERRQRAHRRAPRGDPRVLRAVLRSRGVTDRPGPAVRAAPMMHREPGAGVGLKISKSARPLARSPRREWSAAVFALAAATDWLDGLARRLSLETPFGAFFDPVADKLMVSASRARRRRRRATRPPPVRRSPRPRRSRRRWSPHGRGPGDARGGRLVRARARGGGLVCREIAVSAARGPGRARRALDRARRTRRQGQDRDANARARRAPRRAAARCERRCARHDRRASRCCTRGGPEREPARAKPRRGLPRVATTGRRDRGSVTAVGRRRTAPTGRLCKRARRAARRPQREGVVTWLT